MESFARTSLQKLQQELRQETGFVRVIESIAPTSSGLMHPGPKTKVMRQFCDCQPTIFLITLVFLRQCRSLQKLQLSDLAFPAPRP